MTTPREENIVEPFTPGESTEFSVANDAAAEEHVVKTEREMAAVRDEKEEYQAAKKSLVSKVRELRDRVRREAAGLGKEQISELVEKEIQATAGIFTDSEQLAVLKKLMPNRVDATTAREKFAAVIAIGLNLKSYFDKQNFLFAFEKMFGKKIDQGFTAEYDDLAQQLEDSMSEILDDTDTDEDKA